MLLTRASIKCSILVETMNKQEYIRNIIKYIQNDRMREESLRELSDHFEDRKQYYLNAGFEEEVAEEKTIACMGDAELIGTRIGKVHGKRLYVPLLLIEIVLGLTVCFFALILGALLWSEVLYEQTVLSECALLVFLFLFAYIGLRYRYKSILIIACIPLSLFLTFRVVLGWGHSYENALLVSGTVWETVYLVLGKFKMIYEIASRWRFVETSWWLQVLSVLFYAWIGFCVIAGMTFMVREDREKCSLRQKKMLKLIKRSVLALGACVLVSGLAFCAVYYTAAAAARESVLETYSGSVIYAKGINQNQPFNEMEEAFISDDTKSLTYYVEDISIESKDTIQLYGAGKDGEPVRRIEKKQFDNNIAYYTVIYEVNVKTTKDYMFFSNKGLKESFSQDKWLKVRKGEKYLIAFEEYEEYPLNFVEFTIQ